MKNWMFTLLVGVSGSAFGVTPTYGTLSSVSQLDGIVSYKCELSTGSGSTITLSHNTDSKTMQLELIGKVNYPQSGVTKIEGPYVEVEIAEVNKPVVKNYELHPAGFHINLAYTAGKALPVLTLAYGATPLICQ